MKVKIFLIVGTLILLVGFILFKKWRMVILWENQKQRNKSIVKQIASASLIILMLMPLSLSSKDDSYEVKVVNYIDRRENIIADGYAYCSEKVIIINGYGTEKLYRKNLQHELNHILCYKLFGDCDFEHIRCFTKGYNEGKGLL